MSRLTALRIAQLGLLVVAGICLFMAQQADASQRPTGRLLIATCCLVMGAGVLGGVHAWLTRRAVRR